MSSESVKNVSDISAIASAMIHWPIKNVYVGRKCADIPLFPCETPTGAASWKTNLRKGLRFSLAFCHLVSAFSIFRLQFSSPETPGYVGFANLPNQVHRKSVKKGFEFTLMVVGESGLGKSTLVNALFLTDLYPERVIPDAVGEFNQLGGYK